tara:strand:- start:701 stop:1021 length:321 start_codon:yes stop_codon:yes gene_type:complete
MATIGVNFGINKAKIDQSRIKKGWLNCTVFINLDEKDQFDNNGGIKQRITKEERDGGMLLDYIGNVSIFYDNREGVDIKSKPAPAPTAPPQAGIQTSEYLDDDIPF